MTTPAQLRDRLQGPVVAMTTHFHDDLSLDLDAMKRLTEYYMEQATPTVIVTGSTGEFFSLSDEERKQTQRAVIDTVRAAGSSMTVIAGVSHSGSLQTIELARYAQDIGADGVMVTPPYYGTNGGGFPVIQHHFDTVTRAIDIGVVIYFSGAVLWQVQDVIANPTMMLNLVAACNGRAAGFKDATGNFAFYRAHSQLLQGTVATMGSSGMSYYLWGFDFGSPCFLTGLGNIWPQREIEFYQHLKAGRRDEALRIVRDQDGPYITATKATRRYWACVKALQEMVGLPGGKMRPPLVDCTPEQREVLRQVCTEIGLLTGC